MGIVDQIMEYESGQMSENSMINFFSELIKNGMAWTLQGHYGRTAKRLIDRKIISKDGTINHDVIEELRMDL